MKTYPEPSIAQPVEKPTSSRDDSTVSLPAVAGTVNREVCRFTGIKVAAKVSRRVAPSAMEKFSSL